MTGPRKNAGTTRGRPFAKGNPGRPKGARNRATVAVEALLDGEAEALTRKAIAAALAGDVAALRLCLYRIAPPRKDALVRFAVPAMKHAKDAAAAMSAILQAVAEGDLSPGEAQAVAALVEGYRRTLETTEIEARIAALEDKAR